MNCPICNKKLTLIKDADEKFATTYRYICNHDTIPHFMTDTYHSEAEAAHEVESGNSYSRSSNVAYWHIKLGGNVTCSHCGNVCGTVNNTGTDYNNIVEKNRFCNNCGRSMSKPIVTVTIDTLPAVPEAITVADYNKVYHKNKGHAESFVKLVDSAIDKCNDSQDARKQFECIGWSTEVRDTIRVALEMYQQIMKAKCINRVVDSHYRDVVLCKHCGRCMIKTSEGYLCRDKGFMPLDGFCSQGLIGKASDGENK